MLTIDRDWLEMRFGLRSTVRTDAFLTVRADALLIPAEAERFVREYAEALKGTDQTPAAAYSSANLSATALALHYAISVWNVGFEIPLSKVVLQVYRDHSPYLLFALTLEDVEFTAGPEEESARGLWRDELLSRYYRDTARPLFESLSAAAGLHLSQLWGQLPTRFNFAFEKLDQELRAQECSSGESAADRLREDYRVVSREWDGTAFGRSSNPLNVQIRYIDDYRGTGSQLRMKNACCLYYKTGEQAYCYTCPRLKAEERQKIGERLMAASKH